MRGCALLKFGIIKMQLINIRVICNTTQCRNTYNSRRFEGAVLPSSFVLKIFLDPDRSAWKRISITGSLEDNFLLSVFHPKMENDTVFETLWHKTSRHFTVPKQYSIDLHQYRSKMHYRYCFLVSNDQAARSTYRTCNILCNLLNISNNRTLPSYYVLNLTICLYSQHSLCVIFGFVQHVPFRLIFDVRTEVLYKDVDRIHLVQNRGH
jgi:hypothetical protein